MNRFLSRVACVLAILLMCPSGFAFALPGDPAASLALPGITAELYPVEDGGPADQPLQNGDTLSQADALYYQVTKDTMADIAADQVYAFSLPEQIAPPQEGGSIPLTDNIGGTAVQFGVLGWSAGSRELTVTFHNFDPVLIEGLPIGLNDLTHTRIGFACALNGSDLVADAQGNVDIELPGGKTVRVVVSELVPSPPKLEKAVSSLDDAGKATWTVTYHHPQAAYAGQRPTELVDVLPEGLTYVPGSAAVIIGGVADPAPQVIAGEGTLTYALPENLPAGVEVQWSYRTQLTNAAIQDIWRGGDQTLAYQNQVVAQQGGASISPTCSATSRLTVPDDWIGRQMLSKSAAVNRPENPGDPWTIDWTVQVNTVSRHFQSLQLRDEMGGGLKLIQESVKVSGDGEVLAIPPQIETPSNGPAIMVLDLVQDGSPNPAKARYTIAYTTQIDPAYFSQSGSLTDDDLKNTASLRYCWPAGEEPGGEAYAPTVSKGPGNIGVHNKLIYKEAVGYDYATRRITWKYTVNPNRINLTQLTAQDILGSQSKQRFVGSDDPGAVDAARAAIRDSLTQALTEQGYAPENVLVSLALSEQQLDFVLQDVGTNSFSFEFGTYADDPAIWAGNGAALGEKPYTYTNTVTAKADGTAVDGQPISADCAHTAKLDVPNAVLRKAQTAFDPLTRELTWTLTINENAVALGEVTITDALPALLSCAPAKALLDGQPFDGMDNRFTVSDDNVVTIRLKEVTQPHQVTFTTVLDVDAAPFGQLTEVALTNQASLTSADNPVAVPSNEVNVVFDNHPLKKEAVNLKGSTLVSYTVYLNPYGMDLLKGSGSDILYLRDTLGDGLYLDVDSIRLYEAIPKTPASWEGDQYRVELQKQAQIEDVKVQYDAPENAFSLEIPDAAQRYLVTYDAYAVRAGVSLDNQVSLTGSILPSGAPTGHAGSAITLSAFGNTSFRLPTHKFFSIQIKKVNGEGQVLQGARFGLYAAQEEGALLTEATCDADTGICTLALPKREVQDRSMLYWRETAAPDAYVRNDEWHRIDLEQPPENVVTMVNLAGADAIAGRIDLRKIDAQQTTPLQGAAFALYADQTCATLVSDQPACSSDGAVFTFTGLYPGRTYWAREVRAPEGYVPLAEPIAIQASAAVAVTDIGNEPANVTLTVSKTDAETGSPLAGVTFGLYLDAACTQQVDRQETDSQGGCTFQGLLPYTPYFLREIANLPGYVPDDTVYPILTGDNGAALHRAVTNFQSRNASLQIVKTDVQSGAPLAGAVFELYGEDQSEMLSELITDAQGICTFTGMRAGRYFVREAAAPDGYRLDAQWVAVELGVDETRLLRLTNQRLPMPTPEPIVSPAASASAEQSPEPVPRTGDEGLYLWALLCGLSALGLISLLCGLRRQRR